MTGRGIDQVLLHPGDPALHEPYMRNAEGYVQIAERKNRPIPRPVDFDYIWGGALAELDRSAPDLRIINLETSITDNGEYWPDKGIHYRMHPDNTPCITAADIDLCILSNNHVLDWGYGGLTETLNILSRHRVRSVGAGESAPEASAGANFLARLSDREIGSIRKRIEAVKQSGDVVVFSIHWGGNWGYRIPPDRRRFAHDLIDRAGVDVVYGHSSHHPLGIEVHNGKLILYGCGDFINDYEGIGGHEEYRPDLTLMYLPEIDSADGTLVSLRLVPFRMSKFRLNSAGPGDIAWLEDRLDRECGKLGAGVTRIEDRGGNPGPLMLQW